MLVTAGISRLYEKGLRIAYLRTNVRFVANTRFSEGLLFTIFLKFQIEVLPRFLSRNRACSQIFRTVFLPKLNPRHGYFIYHTHVSMKLKPGTLFINRGYFSSMQTTLFCQYELRYEYNLYLCKRLGYLSLPQGCMLALARRELTHNRL